MVGGRTIWMLRPSLDGLRPDICGFLGSCEYIEAPVYRIERTNCVPRNPVPPHTTSFFFAAVAIVI